MDRLFDMLMRSLRNVSQKCAGNLSKSNLTGIVESEYKLNCMGEGVGNKKIEAENE